MRLYRPECAILSGQALLGGSGWIMIDEIGLEKATAIKIVCVALRCLIWFNTLLLQPLMTNSPAKEVMRARAVAGMVMTPINRLHSNVCIVIPLVVERDHSAR